MSALRFGPGALQLARLAARALGWRPDEFWRATPAELAAILCPEASNQTPMSRNDLTRLMERDND